MLEKFLYIIKKIIPKSIFRKLQPSYHFMLAFAGALLYRFPSNNIKVVGITGTKGKTTTAELVNALLEEAGYKTSLAGTLRFKIGDSSKPNLHKMTMPGRFFMQKFLRNSVKERCEYAVIEMTSEGVKQFRHKFMSLDTLIVTNISPEHIESHGSYEKYLEAKLKIAKALERSRKKDKAIIVNSDDKESDKFLAVHTPNKITYSISDAKPFTLENRGSNITLRNEGVRLNLPGEFNIYNALAAATYAKSEGIDREIIKKALEKFSGVRGRMEEVNEGQNFTVIVDYAHTKDSLEKAYGAYEKENKICILGAAGGGRDRWKREEMGSVVDEHCSHIILTDEDPYDEDPKQIITDIKKGIKNTTSETIMDRREAIKRSFEIAKGEEIVFITGKGTDPYIMGPKGTKTPWDDATVAREELRKLINIKQ